MTNCGCDKPTLCTTCNSWTTITKPCKCSTDIPCVTTTPCVKTTDCCVTPTCKKTVTYTQQATGPCKETFKHTIKILNPFNIPALNAKASVALETTSVANGTIVFNDLYGWLRLGDYDSESNTATLLNFLNPSTNPVNGLIMNEVGKAVSGCSVFVTGTPEYGSADASSDQRCLLGDFYAKAASDGTDPGLIMSATLSSVDGISPGDRLFFGIYEYVVKAIYAGGRVDFYNAGSGAPDGTLISGGLDCNGNCLLIVSVVGGESPCEGTPVQEVSTILGCNEGTTQQFTGSVDGQIPVWDGTSQSWKPESLSIDTTLCATLDADFTISDAAEDYVIVVSDSSIFSATGAGSRVMFAGVLWFVVNVIDATHITIRYVNPPADPITYTSGMSICVANCCEYPPSSDTVYIDGVSEGVTEVNDDNGGVGGQYLLATITLTWTNPSPFLKACTMINLAIAGEVRLIKNGTWVIDIRDGDTAAILYTHLVDLATANGADLQVDNPGWNMFWNPTYPESGLLGILGPGESYTKDIDLFVTCTNDTGGNINLATLNLNLLARGLIVTTSP